MSKKGGYYCAFKNCRGLSRRDKRSFFRFPKDPLRSKQWVRACDRNDLMEKTPLELFNSYRVCAKHFTDSMFLNDLRNRLQPNSVPMQLEPPEENVVSIGTNNVITKDSSCNDNNIFLIDDCNKNNNYRNTFDDQQTECHQDSIAKLLSNCILQKISADEFYKATGIRINEPVSAVKTNEDHSQNSNPTDHIYSSIKINNNNNNGSLIVNSNNNNNNNEALAIENDNDNSNNFSIEAFCYQDLINSLPMSLISETSSVDESQLEINNISFDVANKNNDIVVVNNKLPDNFLLSDQTLLINDVSTQVNCVNAYYESNEKIETITKNDCYNEKTVVVVKNKTDVASQTENFYFLNNKISQTNDELNFTDDKTTDNDLIINKFKYSSNFKTLNFDKRRIKKLLQSKEQKIRELKLRVKTNFTNNMDKVTLKQYESLTEKFFPKETSDFIKIQAQLFKKKTNDRKYSLEFKKQCLSLLLAGPKTYKNLQRLFCLPGARDLKMLKYQ